MEVEMLKVAELGTLQLLQSLGDCQPTQSHTQAHVTKGLALSTPKPARPFAPLRRLAGSEHATFIVDLAQVNSFIVVVVRLKRKSLQNSSRSIQSRSTVVDVSQLWRALNHGD